MPSRSREATPTAPYSLGAPSAPFITIPVAGVRRNANAAPMGLTSDIEEVAFSQEEAQIMRLRCQKQIAIDRSDSWMYEQRWKAQAILDFMYLGPTSVLKDTEFLKAQGITMAVVIRDTRMRGTKGHLAEKAAAEIGLELCYMFVDGMQTLIHELPSVLGAINSHLVRYYKEFGGGDHCPGKVLVTCESGNGRSAAVVAAYIMMMFGKDLISTVQYVVVQRFCTNFDEDIKQMLRTWHGLLQAKVAVARSRSQEPPRSHAISNGGGKRGRDDEDEEMEDDDDERFRGRESFAPFADVDRMLDDGM